MVLEPTLVARQQLERDPVPHASHRHAELRPDFKTIRVLHDLVLNAGAPEQQVHEDLRRTRNRPDEADRGQAVNVVLPSIIPTPYLLY